MILIIYCENVYKYHDCIFFKCLVFLFCLCRKKEQNDIYAVPGQWVSAGALKNCSHTPTDSPNQHGAHLEYMSSEISRTFIVRGLSSRFEHYENVPSSTAGFVTNDIYEACRSPAAVEAGWVENDIYGY